MRIHLQTLGCRLNEAESETWAREFQVAGHRIVTGPEEADIIVLNSCAVTGEAVRKSRQWIRRMQRQSPKAKLVLTGCYATLERAEAESLSIDLLIANADKANLVRIAHDQLGLETMPAFSTEPGEAALFALGRQRAFVKVQDGCRYRCTFCIVTVARGEERSRPLSEIVAEIDHLHRQGIQEVVLTGVHLGGYGSDLGTSLRELIHTVLRETGIPRLRLGSLEPWDLPAGFFDLFEDPRFLPHLHLPLQSGSDAVLRRMARRCKTRDFARLIEEARRRVPDLTVTTDIIVGFPGETEVEWRDGLRFIEAMGFGDIHIFAYSKREGTKAAAMPDQVQEEVKRQRSRNLHDLALKLKRDTMQRFLGRTFAVLWENRRDGIVLGYTPNYLRVAADPQGEDLSNRITPTRLSRLDPAAAHLWGEVTPIPRSRSDTR
jgi:threonylcarbamoyladenosine tRNA methylthiotransferase MtaB